MQDSIKTQFFEAREAIKSACWYLEGLAIDYQASDLDPVTKAGRVDALNAKIDYLKGLPLNENAHPWVED